MAATGVPFIILLFFSSCEKTLRLKFEETEIKQVIIANFSSDNFLSVNISKSKQPNDFSPVEFLQDCQVDLYEDGVFKEILPFILKDTLSGLGYYTSTFKLVSNKTYKIVSKHSSLPVAEASEYLPPPTRIVNFALLQHADSTYPSMQGQYVIAFQDSTIQQNYYFLSTYYKVLRPVVDDLGDTTYKSDYINNIPSYTPDIPNNNNYNRLFTSDVTFDGQLKTWSVTFPSQYNNTFKEIILIVELSNIGKNFYDWTIQHLKPGTDYLNQGQLERINPESNIINGFGHFSSFSSSYITIQLK